MGESSESGEGGVGGGWWSEAKSLARWWQRKLAAAEGESGE